MREPLALGLESRFASTLDSLLLPLYSLSAKKIKLFKIGFHISLPVHSLSQEVFCDGEEVGTVPLQIVLDEDCLLDSLEESLPVFFVLRATFEDVVHEAIDDFGEHGS